MSPVRLVWRRRPFFRRGHRGLLWGEALTWLRGRGRSGGAREQPVLKNYMVLKTESAVKIHLDITTTTT